MPSIPPPLSDNARLLAAYFSAFNTTDQHTWETAFDATWHPDGTVDLMPMAQFKGIKRGLLGRLQIDDFKVVRQIDPDTFEYTASANGSPAGPNTAHFKDGRVFRLELSAGERAVAREAIDVAPSPREEAPE